MGLVWGRETFHSFLVFLFCWFLVVICNLLMLWWWNRVNDACFMQHVFNVWLCQERHWRACLSCFEGISLLLVRCVLIVRLLRLCVTGILLQSAMFGIWQISLCCSLLFLSHFVVLCVTTTLFNDFGTNHLRIVSSTLLYATRFNTIKLIELNVCISVLRLGVSDRSCWTV